MLDRNRESLPCRDVHGGIGPGGPHARAGIMVRRKRERRWSGRANRPGVEGLETRQLLAVTFNQFPLAAAEDQPTSVVSGTDGNLYYTGTGSISGGTSNFVGLVPAIGVFSPFSH